MSFVISCDCHSQNIKAIAFDVDQKLHEIERFNVLQDVESFNSFFSSTQTYNPIYLLENANSYARRLKDFLLEKNVKVFDVHPGSTGALKKTNPNIEKSDWNDSKYIAQAYQLNVGVKQLTLNFEEDYYTDLEDISYQRWELGQKKGSIKKKIGIRLYKKLGANYKEQFQNHFWSVGIIHELSEIYKDSKNIKEQSIYTFVQNLIQVEEEIKRLDSVLAKLANEEVNSLMEIKGCGLLIACRLVSIIRLGKPLKSVRSLAKWAGIAPVLNASGGTAKHRANLRGNRHLNHLIHQIAITKIKGNCKDEKTKAYFQKLLKSGKGEKVCLKKVKNVVGREISRRLISV